MREKTEKYDLYTRGEFIRQSKIQRRDLLKEVDKLSAQVEVLKDLVKTLIGRMEGDDE